MNQVYSKSQLTILIIVGILVFAIIIFLLYLILFKTEKRLEKEKVQTLDTGLQTLKEYINTCLEQTASRAVELTGKQAGYIYTSQGGPTPDPITVGSDYISFDGSKIKYNLRHPTSDIGSLYYWQPINYPWPGFPYVDSSYTTIDLEHGYYGINQLPALASGNNSILSQIEHYVNAKAPVCLDFKEFRQYTITRGNISSSLIITDNNLKGSLILNVKVPLEIFKVTGEELTSFESFSVPLRVRLKLVHDLARTVIEQESTSLLFKAQLVNFEGMEVKVYKNVYEKDSVISITDSKSTLFSRPYTFSFAAQNRYPALHFINQDTLPDLKEGDLITFDSSSILIIIRDGEPIFTHSPGASLPGNAAHAYDPDDDPLNISYNPSLPYTITNLDTPPFSDRWQLTITVTDGMLSDYENLNFKTIAQ